MACLCRVSCASGSMCTRCTDLGTGKPCRYGVRRVILSRSNEEECIFSSGRFSMENDVIEVRSGEQLDWAKVELHLRAHIPGISTGTLKVRQFPSGASNLTYL